MQQGLVSTIIPVYNRPEMLVDAVGSVLKQSYRSIEVIIVDDGSTDETLSTALKLSADNACVTVLSIENSGPAIARERGREQADGEFIQYLDSDDLLHPNKFKQQIASLMKKPDCGVCYCIQQLCDMSGSIINPAWMRSGELFEDMFPAMLGGRIWGTPVPLYRAELLEKAGPWLDLRNQEDWEYDCRIASLGVKLSYCAEVLVTVRRHSGDHLGQVETNPKQKLIDKSQAYMEIYKHAASANISKHNEERQRFNRMSFMLARHCAEYDLKAQAKSLIEVCEYGAISLQHKIEYKAYCILSSFCGWKNIAIISRSIDRLRT